MTKEILFESGTLILTDGIFSLESTPWAPNKVNAGVFMKNLLTAKDTNGAFSYHLVRVEKGFKIALHQHDNQIETHEVVSGSGICQYGEQALSYAPGTLTVFKKGFPHEIRACDETLYIYAKFIPALL